MLSSCYHMAMAQLLVRNLDEKIVAALKARAERERKSLEQLLREILKREARPNAVDLIASARKIRAMGKTAPRSMNATDLIREDRDANHGRD